ncbi:MAG: ABC transporter permease [Solirubrobacteraceae bacterium]
MRRGAATRVIAEREIRERLSGRVTRIVTVATAILVVAGIAIPGLVKSSASATRIGLVGSRSQALAPAFERAAKAAQVTVRLPDVAGVGAARALLDTGKLDAAIDMGASSATIEVKQSLSAQTRAVIAAAVDEAHFRSALAKAGVPVAKVLPAVTPVPLTTVVLKPQPADQDARYVAAIFVGLLMYLAITLYGTAVATGVAQEKTSRTAEVLLSAVRPQQLLVGKVVGIGLVGLGQLAIAAIAGLLTNAAVHSAKIPGSVWVLMPAFLAFFVAGFALYAFALAATGALVARPEEAQSATLPLIMPLPIGYVLTFVAIGSPNATWLRVVSWLPPLTPTLMPARIALGTVDWWEYPLVTVIMLASIYGIVRVASAVYAGGLLRGGERLSWWTALRGKD